MRDVDGTVQGTFQTVPKKPSGGCNGDTNQPKELTLAGFCCVSRTEGLEQVSKAIT